MTGKLVRPVVQKPEVVEYDDPFDAAWAAVLAGRPAAEPAVAKPAESVAAGVEKARRLSPEWRDQVRRFLDEADELDAAEGEAA